MHPAIAQHRSGISAICLRYGIRRLEVFGSAARADDFDPEHSDANFLVEFAPGVQPGLDTFFGAKAALEALLGRGVDLVKPGAMRNPYVLATATARPFMQRDPRTFLCDVRGAPVELAV